MSTLVDRRPESGDGEARRSLLAGIGVGERRLECAGVSTLALVGGEGPAIVLLHGPGESGVKWMRVLPDLLRTNRVIAPDLPAHGGSDVPAQAIDTDLATAWLGDLIEATCGTPPTVVGHVLGGAIAARFAARDPERLARLVLVDSLGLGRFRPSPRFAATLFGFVSRPNERSYGRFMRQCSYDLDELRAQMGEAWDPFVTYNLELARSPTAKAAGRMLRAVGIPRIPPEELARIAVPTTLIWGRQDRANRLRVAERASHRYGWPLRVIEDCADDPGRDRPEAFLRALRRAMD